MSPIPSPSQLPPTQKVPVASLLCIYGADSVLYGSSAGPYRLVYQKAKTIRQKKMAHDSQIVRANENFKLSHGGPSQGQGSGNYSPMIALGQHRH